MYFREDGNLLSRLLDNTPLEETVNGIAEAIRLYGKPGASMLTVIQPGEANRFDQLGIEQKLWEMYGIGTLRKTLGEIGLEGSIREGHLQIDGKTAALVYYRAGYTPGDFKDKDSIAGRCLIESSSAIQVPDLWMQLAGMKKIQQALTRTEILERFAPADQLQEMASTFVAMHSLDEPIDSPGETQTAFENALEHPGHWVLKPQREGGGNNFFDSEMVDTLKRILPQERNNFVLMERIRPRRHRARLVVEEKEEELECVSEVGRFGVLLADSGNLIRNEDCGYLVRTKSADVNEGGVCAGYSCLNTIITEKPGSG